MWQNSASNDSSGLALHLRGKAEGVLGSTGLITEISGSAGGYRGAVENEGSKFTTEDGSVISKITGTPVLYSNFGTDLLNGVIEDSTHDYIIGGFAQKTTIGETGVIQNCIGTGGASMSIVYTSNSSQIFLKGNVRNNTASYAFYIINQSGGGASLTMYDGAVLTGKENEDGTYKHTGTGVYINASGSSFTMEGGTISGFATAVYCRGKSKKKATFIMNGGLIEDNTSYAVNFSPLESSGAIAELNGGEIRNNGSSYQISAYGGAATDTRENIKIAEGVLKDNKTIYLSFGQLQLDEKYSTISLGKPSTVAESRIADLLHATDGHEEWSTTGTNGLWFKPTKETFHFTIKRSYSIDTGLGLYFGYLPLKADGTPADQAELKLVEVANTDMLDITIPDLEPGTSYAAMFIHNASRTLRPSDLTIYTGGNDGLDTSGLPSQNYTFEGLPKYSSKIQVSGLPEESFPNQAEAAKRLKELFRISYLDAEGKEITDDLTAGEYTMRLTYTGPSTRSAVSVDHVTINGNNLYVEDGKLTIRYVEDIDAAKQGNNVTVIEQAKDDESAPVKEPTLVTKNKVWYTNGRSNRKVTDANNVKLMHDKLLTSDQTNVENLMKEKGETALLSVGEKKIHKYDFHYLDVVDTNNANAWVSGAADTYTVYLPYPAGANKDNTVVLHYDGLNREYGFSGQPSVAKAVEDSEVSVLTEDEAEGKAELLDQNIKLTIPQGEFGSYAVVWTVQAAMITVNYRDAETKELISSVKPYETKVALNDPYDVSEDAKIEIAGYEFVAVGTDGAAASGTADGDKTIYFEYRQKKTPTIQTKELPSGKVGDTYAQQIEATGDRPMRFEISGGKLPDGLLLSEDGKLTGTPTEAGTFTFTVMVSNAAGTASVNYSITITKASSSSSSTGRGSSGGSYTAGIDGNWMHMDPNNFNQQIKDTVPQDATPVSSPKWHTWKFFLNNGQMIHSRWAYIKNPYAESGQPREGWFAFDADGIMQYGWYLDTKTGNWYYLHRDSDGMLGTMETGWHYDGQDGKWYYLNPSGGAMMLGWQKIGEKWYYFNPYAPSVTWNYSKETGGWTYNGTQSRPYGSMYQNETTPDGYQVGSDGAWIH